MVAYIISNSNLISNLLIKDLLEKSFEVVVITTHKEKYSQVSANLEYKDFNSEITKTPSYLFFIDGISSHEAFFTESQIEKAFNIIQTYSPKTQVILPYAVNEKTRPQILKTISNANDAKNGNTEIIYLGEVYGPGMNIFSQTYFGNTLKNIWQSKSVGLPFSGINIYLISAPQAVSQLMRGIFSFGFGKREIVLTSKINSFRFLEDIKKIVPITVGSSDQTIGQDTTVPCVDFQYVDFTFRHLEETVQWLIKNPLAAPVPIVIAKPEVTIKKFRKPKVKKGTFKKVGIFILIIFWILALPFLTLYVSSIATKIGFSDLSSFNLTGASFYFVFSSKLADLSRFSLIFPSEEERLSGVISGFDKVGLGITSALTLGQKIGSQVFNDRDYDLTGESNQLFLNLDDLYKQSSFLAADINSFPTLKFFLPNLDLNEIRLIAMNGRSLASNLPQLLGGEEVKKYIILLQDAKELRATGGAIRDVGVFSFDKGKLSTQNFYDTSQLDRQLKGLVLPPNALQKYLGETNWKLADSNWDPNFPYAAHQAQWFVGKEINETSDGAVAVDLDLYNKLQDLRGNFLQTASEILKGLGSKDIQVFLNDSLPEGLLTNLNWDGGVNFPTCPDNCSVNSLGLVESNLGQNTVNPDIERDAKLTMDLAQDAITSNLEITYENLSETQPYRNYVRILIPTGASITKITESINGEVRTLQADSDNGVLIQIPSKETSQIQFSWRQKSTLDFTRPGKVLIYIRRQPGIAKMPTSISVNNLVLQVKGSYNTDLTADFNTKIEW